MRPLRRPRRLQRGALLGIAAPGGPVDAERLAQGRARLEQAGFRTRCRDDITCRSGFLAGSDERRAEELMELVRDPEIDGIVCARGGYGAMRILERLDAQLFAERAKPLVGYSDATALLLWQNARAGLIGFHGPMLDRGAELDAESLARLVALLCGEGGGAVLDGVSLRPGHASGHLVGGSLSLVAASLGAPWEIDTRGAIVLLEDVGEIPYRVDRMLRQLLVAGKFESAVGLGFGAFEHCADARHGVAVDEVLAAFADEVGLPCLAGLPFGHGARNFAWPMGGRATLAADPGGIAHIECAVE